MFFTNVQKANIIAFVKTFFWHPLCLWKIPPSRFLLFPPPCMPRFCWTFSSPNFWGVKKAPCKKFHVFGENWQRNQFPKLTTLWLLLHPCYNFAIVHWLHLLDFSPLCIFKCLLKLSAQKDANSHWLQLFDFSSRCIFKCFLPERMQSHISVCFQMCPQVVCMWRCIVTLVALVGLFSNVRFQMSPQIACMRRSIVTLVVAFVWLDDIVILFLQDFPICILKTKAKCLFHCQCVLCFA